MLLYGANGKHTEKMTYHSESDFIWSCKREIAINPISLPIETIIHHHWMFAKKILINHCNITTALAKTKQPKTTVDEKQVENTHKRRYDSKAM